ncbi:G2/mitotic-specific cyclin cig1 [Schizosaccharomyces pombe]
MDVSTQTRHATYFQDENQLQKDHIYVKKKSHIKLNTGVRAPFKAVDNINQQDEPTLIEGNNESSISSSTGDTFEEDFTYQDKVEIEERSIRSTPKSIGDDDLENREGSFDAPEGILTHGKHRLPTIPEWTKEDLAALSEAAARLQANPSPEDIETDPSMVPDYDPEIFHYMQSLERKLAPPPNYMSVQQEIDWVTRHMLVDWIVQVQIHFRLLPETLFLAVNLIDRFLSIKVVSLQKVQLVGLSALLIACKYEEIHPPSIYNFAHVVQGIFTVDEIIRAERYMLMLLDFDISWPGPMSFLRRISRADSYDHDIRMLAKYLQEVTLMDEIFIGAHISFIAATAYYLSMQMLGHLDWTPCHVYYSGYTARQLKPCAIIIMECLVDAPNHHNAIYRKYSENRMKRVSAFAHNWVLSVI